MFDAKVMFDGDAQGTVMQCPFCANETRCSHCNLGDTIKPVPLDPQRMMIRERLVEQFGETVVDAMIRTWRDKWPELPRFDGSHVEVHFYKASGKWYGTGHVDMRQHFSGELIHDALLAACNEEFVKGSDGKWGYTFSPESWLERGCFIVCPRPHHEHAHPLMLRNHDPAPPARVRDSTF